MHRITFDVESGASIGQLAAEVTSAHPQLNVLINNAGIMRSEKLNAGRDLADAEQTITTNLLGPIRLTNALIDQLVAQPNATIVNVSSGLAFVPLIASPTYSATKAAIHAYTVAMRAALRGHIEVIELAPPAVQTQLTPGQESNAMFMPLGEFIDEVLALFAEEPTPPEILVKRVGFQRFAEAESRFDHTLAKMNGMSH